MEKENVVPKMPANIKIVVAGKKHYKYAEEICDLIEASAKDRGTGIAKRQPAYIISKMSEGKVVIALENNSKLIGSCYIESWEDKSFVVNSGLIVHPDYRKFGLARKIKRKIFNLSRKMFPGAKIFGITTSIPVMKINLDLGYKAVPFNQLTKDDKFWKGCVSCVNYKYLQKAKREYCLCKGMLYEQ
ncbi:MAG: GNAT family N-acetyltransferase [Patescibacteria group bacterium]